MNEIETAKKLFFEALEFADSSDFRNAELRLRDALRLSPGRATVLTNLSGVLLRQNKPVEAREYAQKAVAADPGSIEALLVLVGCQPPNENIAEALATYDKIVALDPTIAEVHNNRGALLEKLGRVADALASYDRAIALKPDFVDALVNRGNALDDAAEALAFYDKALALNRDLPAAWLGRGNVLDQLKRYHDALTAYDRALLLAPDLTYAWLGRGNVLCKLKRCDEGITAYEKALALEPDLAEAWLGRGNALRDLRRYDDALAAYDKALALQPELAGAWLGRGHVFNDRKRWDDALAAYDHALALNPDSSHAWTCRGDVLKPLKRPQEAIAAYRQALTLGGDAELINYSLAGLGAEPQPTAPPEHYIVNLFDTYADQFDKELVDNLKYRTPTFLANVIKRFASSNSLDILDLGCGTGLVGEELRPLKRTLVGVDLSPNMLEKARQRGIYDDLIAGDLVKFLETKHQAFDIAVAADVLIYLGDLSSVFAAVRTALKDRGLFSFSVERADDGDFVLRTTLRYAHSIDYLRDLAGKNHFVVEMIEPQVLRQDAGADISGYLAVMRLAA